MLPDLFIYLLFSSLCRFPLFKEKSLQNLKEGGARLQMIRKPLLQLNLLMHLDVVFDLWWSSYCTASAPSCLQRAVCPAISALKSAVAVI